MNSNQVLYEDWIVDFRKILICCGIILLSAVPSLGESKALSIAILVQSAGNIDSYWDFLKEERICMPLKRMLVCVITLSFLAGIIVLLSLGGTQNYFEIQNHHIGGMVKVLTLLAVSFPVVLLIADIKVKRLGEDYVGSKGNSQAGGEESE